MRILENVDLSNRHTFRLRAKARYLADLHTESDVEELLVSGVARDRRVLVLGRGANVVFSRDFDGLVVSPRTTGMKVVAETADDVTVVVEAGEEWTDFVHWANRHGWGGIETLAGVPGTVGGAAVQHVACYGQNLSDTLVSVSAYRLEDGSFREFSNAECRLGYRTSIFREELSRACLITQVTFKLAKSPEPNITYYSRYESVKDELARSTGGNYTIADVTAAVLRIRARKLPDIQEVGTAGSFFKNPVVARDHYERLKKVCPGLQCYPVGKLEYAAGVERSEERVRVPGGWLIDCAGLAGHREGNCGVWPKQALSLVNYGGATGEELLAFAEKIRRIVREKYGVLLENEAEVI